MNIRALAKRLMMRNDSGFGLPTIACLGICAAFVLYASSQLLTSSMSRISGERITDVMRAAAESGLDWAVAVLSDPTTSATIDTGAPVSIPSQFLVAGAGTNLTGTVTVTKQEAPSTSYLYTPQLDSTQSGNSVGNQVMWRIVTANVTNGFKTKTVRVMLKPVYDASQTTTTTTVQGDPEYYFNKAMFAPGAIRFSGSNAFTDSYDSANGTNPTQFHTGTNGKGDVGSNTAIDVQNGKINGKSTVTAGEGSGTVTIGPNGQSYAGVESSGTISGAPSGTTTSTLTGDSASKQFIPDAPSAPANATNLGAISLSGNKTYTIPAAGNYVVSSISISGNGQLKFPSSGVVNLYVQGSGASISIAGNGISTPTNYPANVRIWYSGSQDVTITGNGSGKAVIFAPNANVKVAGNGAFYGAVVGKSIDIAGNGGFHYDEALGRNQDLVYYPPKTVNTTTTTFSFGNYQAVSWMEF